MMEFEFTLKFTLTTDSTGVDELVECLGAAGCEDALVGIGQSGRIALDFTREADSAKEAIFSALADVKRAIPVAKLLEVTPDFVGLTDVAELVGVSRQNMRKLALTHKESFPAAVHEGSSTLWHLSPVLKWLGEFANYSIKQSLLDVAHIAMQINLAKEACQIERHVEQELLELVA
jgi:hypothetical protein